MVPLLVTLPHIHRVQLHSRLSFLRDTKHQMFRMGMINNRHLSPSSRCRADILKDHLQVLLRSKIVESRMLLALFFSPLSSSPTFCSTSSVVKLLLNDSLAFVQIPCNLLSLLDELRQVYYSLLTLFCDRSTPRYLLNPSLLRVVSG